MRKKTEIAQAMLLATSLNAFIPECISMSHPV